MKNKMFKLSKKIEYAVIALQYIAGKNEEFVSAKEISDNLGMSFEFLSKTLQSMLRQGFLISQHGIKGGYILARNPNEIMLSDIIKALDGTTSIIDCYADETNTECNLSNNCTIKNPLTDIQKKINELFVHVSLSELLNQKSVHNELNH